MVWNEALGEKPLKMISLFSAGISVGLSIKVAIGNDAHGTSSMKKTSKSGPPVIKGEEDHKIMTTVDAEKVKAEKHQ